MYKRLREPALTCPAMKQFTTRTGAADFAIDDDEFHPPPEVPAGMWVELSDLNAGMSGQGAAKQFEIISRFFELVLPEDEHKVFTDRLNDKQKPIGLMMLIEVMEWLLGDAWGMRPILPLSSSAEESATTATTGSGDSSTDGAPPEPSTPLPSPLADSSTSPTTSSPPS